MKVLLKAQIAFLAFYIAISPKLALGAGHTGYWTHYPDRPSVFTPGTNDNESSEARMRREEVGKIYGTTISDPNSDIARLGRAMYSIGTGTQVHHHPVVQIIADPKAMGMTPAEKTAWDQKQTSELEKYHKQIEENEVQNKKLLKSLKTQTDFTKEITKLKERIDEKIRAFDNIEKRALLKVVQNWKSEDANTNMASTVSAVDQLISAIDFHNEHRPSAGTSSEDYNLSAQKLKTSLKELIKAGQNIGSSEQFQVHLNQFEAARAAGIEYLNSPDSGPTASIDRQIAPLREAKRLGQEAVNQPSIPIDLENNRAPRSGEELSVRNQERLARHTQETLFNALHPEAPGAQFHGDAPVEQSTLHEDVILLGAGVAASAAKTALASGAKALEREAVEILCFPGETEVCVKGGHSKRIDQIKVGDYVEACDLASNKCERRKVLKVFKNTADHLSVLSFANSDKKIRTTDNHPFYVVNKSKWVEARKLDPGDRFKTISGSEAVFKGNEIQSGQTTVYNIEVEQHHNYYACGVLVHNCNEAGTIGTGAAKASTTLQAEVNAIVQAGSVLNLVEIAA
jgi:hypothetical protein